MKPSPLRKYFTDLTDFLASVVSPTRLGEMLASAENMEDPDGELTDGETFRMGNVQELI